MKLRLCEYQQLMVKAFRDLFAGASVEAARSAEVTGGFDTQLWKQFVDMDGASLSIAEACGGGGGTLVDAALVGMESGRFVAPIPYADAVVGLRTQREVTKGRLPLDVEPTDMIVWADGTASVTQSSAGTLTGELPYLRAGGVARYLAVSLANKLVLVDAGSARLTRATLANLGRFPMASIKLDGVVPVATFAASGDVVNQATSELRILRASELVGAGRRALELGVEYVKERRQFDAVIGSFQAIQHRLADRATALDAAELLVLRAASYADNPSALQYFGAIAAIAAHDAAERAAKESLQFFGGYGFMLEYDIHLYLRFTKALGVLTASPDILEDALPQRLRARGMGFSGDDADVARHRDDPSDALDFRMTAYNGPLRQTITELVNTHITPAVRAEVHQTGTLHNDALHHAFARKGWIGGSWAGVEGAAQMSAGDAGIFWETVHRLGAPVDGQQLSEMVGYVIMQLGTPEQKAKFVAPMVEGDLLVSLGYSEADSGSDVAAATTRAVRTEGGYLISGAKMFTTLAHVSNYVFLLARTNPDVPKHRGLSMFMVPLSAPGITIQPIETFGGERTNATFYDEVFVPEENRIGAENAGWSVIAAALDFERAAMGGYVGQALRVFDALVDALTATVPSRTNEPALRRQLALENIKLEAARALMDRVFCRLAEQEPLSVEAAMTKLHVTEVLKDLSHLALDLVGAASLLTHDAPGSAPGTAASGVLEHAFRHSQVSTIYGGSNEIQRNIIAQRSLGLPRS